LKTGDKLTILYVDDEEINNFLFVHNFTMYTIITAISGMEALEILKKPNKIDAIISDMSMPVMNGLEFITQAKNILPSIPYFILTAYSHHDEIDLAVKESLIIECFSKPIEVEKIRTRIEENVRK
jgi:two-component system, response regulator, stage 0 sporulation protein F